jgi:uncharacterized protein YecT (DUF1311 family)
MRSIAFSLFTLLLFGFNSASAQDDLRAKTQALAVIADAAAKICFEVKQGGSNVTTVLNGTIDKVSEFKITGQAQLNTDQYQGVLRSELFKTLEIAQNCRKSVFDMLVERMVPKIVSDTGLPVSQSVHLIPRAGLEASISCRHNNEPVEDLICADADLADWDGRMGKIYWQKMNALDPNRRQVLLQSQRDWIKVRNATCKVPNVGNFTAEELAPAKPCILQTTKRRATELAKY